MLFVILLIILAIATGTLGILIKGAFWLFIITAVCLIGAYFVGKASRK